MPQFKKHSNFQCWCVYYDKDEDQPPIDDHIARIQKKSGGSVLVRILQLIDTNDFGLFYNFEYIKSHEKIATRKHCDTCACRISPRLF